jgi:hypothetical protein
LNFFNPHSLSKLMTKHGFVIEKIEWVSRLPKSTFERRVPSVAKPLLPVVHLGTRMSLGSSAFTVEKQLSDLSAYLESRAY